MTGDAFTEMQDRPRIDLSDEFVDEPLTSPKGEISSEKGSENNTIRPSGLRSPDPSSPTSSGLTDEVRRVNIDDATMTSPPTESNRGKEADLSEAERSSLPDQPSTSQPTTASLSPHPEDKPAPLFASHTASESHELASPKAPARPKRSDEDISADPAESADISQSIIMAGNEQLFEPHIETDLNGQPVVGDYLKVMFVENKVVPTILVSWSSLLYKIVTNRF